MFGSLGGQEILLILVIALLLFGPRKLPEIGKTIGRALSEFRRATTDFKSTLEREAELQGVRDARDGLRDVGRDVDHAVRAVPPAPAAAETGPNPRTPEPAGDPPADGVGADGRSEPDP